MTRREWEELELRLAQVEHRLRLVEGPARPAARGPCGVAAVRRPARVRCVALQTQAVDS